MNTNIYIVGLLYKSMGDRFYLDLKCAYCGAINNNIYYAPTCNISEFQCKKCMAPNFITHELVAIKSEGISKEMIKKGIEEHSNKKLIMEVIKNAKM